MAGATAGERELFRGQRQILRNYRQIRQQVRADNHNGTCWSLNLRALDDTPLLWPRNSRGETPSSHRAQKQPSAVPAAPPSPACCTTTSWLFPIVCLQDAQACCASSMRQLRKVGGMRLHPFQMIKSPLKPRTRPIACLGLQ